MPDSDFHAREPICAPAIVERAVDAWKGERLPALECEITERARLQGFQDCEDLIVAWLERKAGELDKVRAYASLATACRSAALAIKLGQHRTGEEEI